MVMSGERRRGGGGKGNMGGNHGKKAVCCYYRLFSACKVKRLFGFMAFLHPTSRGNNLRNFPFAVTSESVR